MQHIPDLYADIDLQMLKRKVQALESAITNPKPWVNLTDEEVKEIANNILEDDLAPFLTFADVIQEKLKEKNNG